MSSFVPEPFSVRPSGQFEGNDGRWSTFLLSVGNPAQSFRALISTSSFSTWLPTPGGCIYEPEPSFVPSNCPELRGVGISQGFQSTGFDEANGTFNYIGINSLDLGNDMQITDVFGSTYNATADLGLDVITVEDGTGSTELSTNTEVPIFGISTWSFFLPSLGIGDGYLQSTTQNSQSFVETLANQSLIPSRSWSYTAGASYRDYLGSLVLGGYDETRLDAETTTHYALAPSTDTTLLQVSLSSIAFSFQNGTEASVPVSETVVIDSTLPYLYLPSSVCDDLAARLSLTYYEPADLYTIENEALVRNREAITQIRIAVGDTQNSGNTTSISFPYAAFDLNATWPTYDQNQSQPFFPIRRAPGETFILGRAFLQEAYISVDFERAYFNLSQATFPSTRTEAQLVPIYNTSTSEDGVALGSSSDGSSSSDGQGSSSSGLSGGAIAGIVVGAVAAALLVIALFIWLCVFKKRREPKRESAAEPVLHRKQSEIIPPLSPSETSTFGRDTISPIDGQFFHVTRVNELGTESARDARAGVHSLPGIHEVDGMQKPPILQADDTPASGTSTNKSSPSNVNSTPRSELEG